MKDTVVIQCSNKLIINGVEIERPKGVSGNNVTVINEKVFIDGYELKGDKWKRTLKAFWHKLF